MWPCALLEVKFAAATLETLAAAPAIHVAGGVCVAPRQHLPTYIGRLLQPQALQLYIEQGINRRSATEVQARPCKAALPCLCCIRCLSDCIDSAEVVAQCSLHACCIAACKNNTWHISSAVFTEADQGHASNQHAESLLQHNVSQGGLHAPLQVSGSPAALDLSKPDLQRHSPPAIASVLAVLAVHSSAAHARQNRSSCTQAHNAGTCIATCSFVRACALVVWPAMDR